MTTAPTPFLSRLEQHAIHDVIIAWQEEYGQDPSAPSVATNDCTEPSWTLTWMATFFVMTAVKRRRKIVKN